MKRISLNALQKRSIENQEKYQEVIREFKEDLSEKDLVGRGRTRNVDEEKILESFTRK